MSMSSTEKSSCRFPWRPIIIVVIVFIILIGGGIICFNIAMHNFFHAVFAGNPGAVNSTADWPDSLKKLVEDANSAKIDLQVFEVHCMCKGYEREYIWRMNANPDLLDFVIKRWDLSPAKPPDYGIFCGQSMLSGDSTPLWWTPKENADNQFYVCKLTLAGEKGERFHIAYDKKRNCLFVWYWDNW